MQAAWTPSISPISETASRISASGSPSCSARRRAGRPTACWASGALQLLLGVLALGDVVEDAVPDRRARFVGLEHRLVEDPDDARRRG